MNKITNLTKGNVLFKTFLFCLSFLFFQLNSYSQDGKKLFKANCAACHSVGANKVVGPGLQGISDKYDREWLGAWIKNSGELIASGDADANAIFEEYNKVIMPPQPVDDAQIDAILEYIANPGTEEVAEGPNPPEGGPATVEEDNSTMIYVFGAAIILLLILVFTLNRTGLFLRETVAKNEGEEYTGPTTLWESFRELLRKAGQFF